MDNSRMPHLPAFIAPSRFTDPVAALAKVREIYDGQHRASARCHAALCGGETLPGHVRACYPFVRMQTDTVARLSSSESARLSYGFVAGPGRFETTLSARIYIGLLPGAVHLLLENHQVELEVGTSSQPIPVHFSFAENEHIEGT
jgi:AMP nucleosidase